MKKRVFFKVNMIILSIVVFFCQLGSVLPMQVEAETQYKVVKLSDSIAWDGDSSLETLGNDTSVGGVAVYNDKSITNEIIQFKANFNLDPNDGWVGMKFRSNLPYNQVWDNNQCYMIMVRLGRIEVLKVKNKVTTSITSANLDLNDNKQHEIQAGVYDTSSGATVVFNVDGKSVINFNDTDPVKGSSLFSINTYQQKTSVKLSVYPDADSYIGKQIDREISVNSGSISTVNDWFVNNFVGMADDQGITPSIEKSEDKVTATGKGGISYKNMLDATAFSFDISISKKNAEEANASTVVFFRKLNRETTYGDNSYGIKVTNDGKIAFVKYASNKMKVFPAYKTNIDFKMPQTIKVEVVPVNDSKAEIYVYVNSSTKAYKYVDNNYNPNFQPPGFFGIVNNDENAIATVGNIKYNGTEKAYTSNDQKVLPVYFADYMMESDNKFLHWAYRPDCPNYLKIEVSDENGKVIGTTEYPKNTFTLPKEHQYTELYLTALNVDGVKSDKVLVDLKDKHSDYYASNVEQIITKPGDTKANFYTKDSDKVFVMNGVNYIGLRYGDHATFEPGLYDPYTTETLFKVLKENGYNTVRVFISGGRKYPNTGLGGINDYTNGIYTPYMENVVDFLKRAYRYGIYVMPNFTENEMISNNYFKTLSNNTSEQSILFSNDGIAAKQQYLKLFLEYIKERDPKIVNSILAMEMQNEFSFNGSQAPFNKTSGTYTFLGGSKYDMSNQNQRRALANAAIKNYYKKMKEAITSVVPGMLLSEGTFTMLAVGKNYDDNKGIMPLTSGDSRYPMTAVELLNTDIDFLDMHVYRYGAAGDAKEVFTKNFDNMQLNTDAAKELMKTKPVILGEYGAMSTDEQEQDFDKGMNFCIGLRDEAMKDGFSGALFWTIDSFQQTTMWSLMDQSGKYLKKMSLIIPPEKVIKSNVVPEDNNANVVKKQNSVINNYILISCISIIVLVLAGSGLWLFKKNGKNNISI